MATDNKYDRQLRLWGKDGQLRLAQANACVLGAGPAATETLKNLVLPGLGRFTVVDAGTVGAEDLGSNFFVTPADVGRPRAESVRDWLVEMNPEDCDGAARIADPAALVAEEPAFFDAFTLVVATQLDPAALEALAALCWEKGLPLVAVRTLGYLGHLRVQVRGHEVVESKPDTLMYDLRMATPWPELQAHAESYDLAALDDKEHKHVPYVVLLMHAMTSYKAAHGGAPPKAYKEKEAFKEGVKAMARPGVDELNVAEAVANAYRVYAPKEMDGELADVLAWAKASELTPASSDFLVLCHAMAGFMDAEGHGLPPVTGVIPDMESDNPKYIALQQCYEAKAAEHCAAIGSRAEALLVAQGRGDDRVPLDPELVQRFCRNAWDLRVVTTRSLADELAKPLLDPDCLYESGREELFAQCPALWYLGLRGADAFHRNHGKWPGGTAGDGGGDEAARLAAEAAEVWSEMKALAPDFPYLSEDYAAEVTRFGGAPELHNVAAVMGGVASQECAKLITHQWIPANNTFVYNGVAGTAQTFEF